MDIYCINLSDKYAWIYINIVIFYHKLQPPAESITQGSFIKYIIRLLTTPGISGLLNIKRSPHFFCIYGRVSLDNARIVLPNQRFCLLVCY